MKESDAIPPSKVTGVVRDEKGDTIETDNSKLRRRTDEGPLPDPTSSVFETKTDKFYCDTSADALWYVPATRSSTYMGGQTRYWYTYEPAGSSGPTPLVLDLHGYTSCAVWNPAYTGWWGTAQQEGFHVIWPQGTNNYFLQPIPCWNAGSCCCWYDNVDDSAFLKHVIETAIADSNGKIDPKRVYIAGHSNGCFMSQTLVADYPGLVAGVACHAGVMGGTHPDPTDAGWIPTSIVTIHGDQDCVIPFESNPSYFGAEENIDLWGASNGCTKKEVVTDSGNDYVTHTWTGCDRGASNQLIQVLGGDHNPYASSGFVDTTSIAWDYLKNFSLDPECASGEAYLMIEIYTDGNPTETSITIAVGSSNNVVYTRDNYDEPNFKYTLGACVPISYCFYFTVSDSGGDGMNGDSGYQVFGNGNLFAEGSIDNGSVETVSFGSCQVER